MAIMTRRWDALRSSIAIGLLSLATPSSCQPNNNNRNRSTFAAIADAQTLQNPFPYFFPDQNAPPAHLFAMPPCHGVKIEDASIDALHSLLAAGTLSSVDLVTCYIERARQTGQYLK